jgi:hypothetical protein
MAFVWYTMFKLSQFVVKKYMFHIVENVLLNINSIDTAVILHKIVVT